MSIFAKPRNASGDECEVVLFQSELVRLRSNVLGTAKDDIVTIPIYLPQGPDWENINCSQFMIDYADIMITPYYEESTMVNRVAYEKGMVTGNFPVYINVYAGNTIGEEKKPKEATQMNQMLYSGVYMTGAQTTTSKVELRGTVFKTVMAGDEIFNKESVFHEWIDNELLENKNAKLQLARVAISLRKSDFKVAASSERPESSAAAYKRLRTQELKQKEGTETKDKKSVKPKKGEDEIPETIDEADNGVLIADAPFYITTKVKVVYKRQPPVPQ